MNSSSNHSIVVVLPAYNESSSIGSVITSLKCSCDVLVVDDGSDDNTSSLAIEYGAFLVKHQLNRGYDKALETGLFWAIDNDYKFAVTMDADGQHPSTLISFFLEELQNGADIVVGFRKNKQRWSEVLFSCISLLLWKINDPLCGMKGYRIQLFKNLHSLDSYNSIGTELLIRALKSNFDVRQVFVPTIPRIGNSRFGNGYRANSRILRALYHGLFFTSKIRESRTCSSF